MDSSPQHGKDKPLPALSEITSAPSTDDRTTLMPGSSSAASPEAGFPSVPGYTITACLGEGGMGTVWRAVQLSTSREVALKLMSPSVFGSPTSHARFLREVELIARLEHPNIARIYDSGLRHGVFCYAMELIDGLPLDKYVRQHRLDARKILELMAVACQAVQHAHMRGVIHRDLKPSNILVTPDGQPHVLDFGLAKTLLDSQAGLATSEDGSVIGTPAYMSPEQAAGRIDLLDTRTDVYSLGTILYFLLTDEFPHEMTGGKLEILRKIAHDEIRRPREFNKTIDPELESLLLKALAHQREERYSSAGAMADDIGNYLRGDPLQARPATTLYFLRKRLQKYRLPASIAAGVLGLLLGGAVFSYFQIKEQRDQARIQRTLAENAAAGEFRARREAEKARNQATEEAQNAKAVNEFLQSMLESASPERTHGRQVTVSEMLDWAAGRIAAGFEKHPGTQAALHITIGRTYQAVGRYNEAAGQFQAALDISRRIDGNAGPDTLTARTYLANLQARQGKLDQAAREHREILETRRKLLGEEHPDTLTSMQLLAGVLDEQGLWRQAEELDRQVLTARQKVLSPRDPSTISTINNLAVVLYHQARFDQAEPLNRQVLQAREQTLGEEDPLTLLAKANLANVLMELNKYDQARKLLTDVLAVRTRVLGKDHPDTAGSLDNLASLYSHQAQYALAEETNRQALAIYRKTLGEEHPDTLTCLNNLAGNLQHLNRVAEAEQLYRQVLGKSAQVLGKDHPATLSAMNNLASSLRKQNRPAEAEQLYRQALDILKPARGQEHPLTLKAMNNLAMALDDEGKYAAAEEILRQVLQIRQRVSGKDNPDTLTVMLNLANVLWEQNKLTETGALYKQASEGLPLVLGPEHPHSITALNSYADFLACQGEHEQAREQYQRLAEILGRVYGKENSRTLKALDTQAVMLALLGKPDQAEEIFRRTFPLHRQVDGDDKVETLNCLRAMLKCMRKQGKNAQADAILESLPESMARKAVATPTSTTATAPASQPTATQK